jgi:hypothetical protein
MLFIADAQALCAIFMLIFFSIKIYEMMAGDKQLEIMPLLRPFGLAMVILWWPTFTRVIAYPTDIIASKTEAMFDGSQTEVNDLRVQRAKLMVDLSDQLFTVQAQTETAKNGSRHLVRTSMGFGQIYRKRRICGSLEPDCRNAQPPSGQSSLIGHFDI